MTSLHIESSGSGPDLVLLHGWAMHGGVFEPICASLGTHYRLHRVDLPGHGRSPADGPFELAPIADQLARRFPSAHWLGWSLGGLLACQLALDHPAAARSLTMVGASPRFTVTDDWSCAVAPIVFEQFAQALASDVGRTLERFLALETLGAEHAQDERHWLRLLLHSVPQPGARVLTEGLAILHDVDLRPRLSQLTCPNLWIGGRRDRLVPPEGLQRAAALAPDGQSQIIDSAAHAPFIGRPEVFAEAVLAFLGAAQR
jgi:pimeloyl-[acyl-carrier protein] methyl ester esterase